jgi:carbonic anhydrase
MERLIDGYARFRAGAWPERRALFARLAAEGQRPRAMVIACSDSRVDPAMIFDMGPGELFVVRNVANLVPPYQPDGAHHGTSAALEFGVCNLGVEDLIVMGHGLCGGVEALMADAEPAGDFVGPWIRLAERARRRVLACDTTDRQLEGEYAVVRVSLENLATFPWIASRVAAGTLRLHGTHFDVRSGVLASLRPDGAFAPV